MWEERIEKEKGYVQENEDAGDIRRWEDRCLLQEMKQWREPKKGTLAKPLK